MKRRLAPILFSLCLGVAAGAMASGETVFVNLDKVYRNYYKTKLGITQLNAQVEDIKKDNEALVQEFDSLKEKYEQLRAESLDDVLSEEIRANKRNEAEETLIDLQNKGKEIQDAQKRANEQLQRQKAGMDKRILEQIRDAIKTESQTKGYLAVINVQNINASALQGTMLVPYYDDNAEITDDILKILNKGYVDEEAGENEQAEAPEAE